MTRTIVGPSSCLASHAELLTSDHILIETWTLIRHRLGRSAAERFWAGIRSGAVTLETVGRADLEAAWSIGHDFADQDFSMVDRTSFAVMQRLGVLRAVSFDSDFAIFRFGPRRPGVRGPAVGVKSLRIAPTDGRDARTQLVTFGHPS